MQHAFENSETVHLYPATIKKKFACIGLKTENENLSLTISLIRSNIYWNQEDFRIVI